MVAKDKKVESTESPTAVNEDNITTINRIKKLEAEVASFWNNQKPLSTRDGRWLSVAKTHFEEGFSALVRAVEQPDSPFN